MPMNTQALLGKIQALPEASIREVEDFVDGLAARSRRQAAYDRLLAIAPALEAAGAPPMTEAAIAAAVEAARAERRHRNAVPDSADADRT